jgi:hypothetical protein
VVSVLAALACFIDINLLLVVSGTSLVVIYALLCVAVFAGRRNGTTSGGHYRMPLFPVPAILAFVALIYVAYQNLLDAAFGRPSLIATVLIMAVAAIYYVLVPARRTGRCAAPTSLLDRRQPSGCPSMREPRREPGFLLFGNVCDVSLRQNSTCRIRPDAGSFRSASLRPSSARCSCRSGRRRRRRRL